MKLNRILIPLCMLHGIAAIGLASPKPSKDLPTTEWEFVGSTPFRDPSDRVVIDEDRPDPTDKEVDRARAKDFAGIAIQYR